MSDINPIQQGENLQTTNFDKQEIMILAIELGDNEKKFLKIYNDSKPEQLAYEFCLQNNLDFNSLQELTEEIKNAFKAKNTSIQNFNQNNINPNNFNQNTFSQNNNFSQNNFQDSNNYSNTTNNNIKENTIEALSQLLNSKNNSKNNTKQSFYKSKQTYNKNKIPINNQSYKKIRNTKKIKNYLSQTASSQSKQRPSKSDLSIATNENIINKSTNSNNIKYITNTNQINNNENIQNNNKYNNINTNNTNNNINLEKENELTNSQSHSIKNPPLSSSNNNNNYILNYGERLYHKGLKINERTNNKIEKLKNDNEKKYKTICTFKPKINNISYNALTNRYNNKLSYNDEDNIINYKDYVNNKIEYLKEKYEIEKKYSFTPKINKRSITMDKNRIGNKNNLTPRYEQLYSNYKKQQFDIHNLSNKIYDNNNLFKPKINNEYNSDLLILPFNERQNAYQSKSTERKKKIKDLVENQIDEHTGQKFFSPVINNNYERKYTNNFNIFSNLYTDYQKMELNKKNLAEEINKKENSTYVYVNNTSNEIYEKQKIKSFEKIFKILDKDQDGIISKFHINNENLPKNINKIFQPIIDELKQDNETLTEKEFVFASDKLFDILNFMQKREIIDFSMNKRKKNFEENKFTFIPKINKDYDENNIIKRNIDEKDKYLVENNEKENEDNNNNKEEKNSEDYSVENGHNENVENEEEEDGEEVVNEKVY